MLIESQNTAVFLNVITNDLFLDVCFSDENIWNYNSQETPIWTKASWRKIIQIVLYR